MIYLGLGSNLGNRKATLKMAIEKIGVLGTVVSQSHLYETAPWGKTDQPSFLNQCISLDSKLNPLQLLTTLQHLEQQLGRQSREKWGPREIDIDILFIDDLIMETPRLSVPHPFAHERAFVLAPLADIAADFMHPARKQTIAKLLETVDAKDVKIIS